MRQPSVVDEFQRRPTRRVFVERKRRTGGERLQAEFAVVDGVREADLAMLVRVVAAEGVGRHERGEPVSVLGDLRGHLQLARADRRGVFAGAVDQELIGDRLRVVAAAAGRAGTCSGGSSGWRGGC